MTNWLKKRMSIHTLVNLINQLFSLSSSLGKSFLSPIKIQKIDVLYGLVRMIIDSSINWTDFIFTVRCTSDFSINSLNQQIFLVETNNPLSQPTNSSLSIHLYLIYSIISCFFFFFYIHKNLLNIYCVFCWHLSNYNEISACQIFFAFSMIKNQMYIYSISIFWQIQFLLVHYQLFRPYSKRVHICTYMQFPYSIISEVNE